MRTQSGPKMYTHLICKIKSKECTHFFYHPVFGPKRDVVTGEWRKLHNEELNDLYSSPNIVRVVKSRRMRWAGHVARMRGGKRSAQGVGGET
jgi:hypothetical protein